MSPEKVRDENVSRGYEDIRADQRGDYLIVIRKNFTTYWDGIKERIDMIDDREWFTAYVGVPEDHLVAGLVYDKIPVTVHGGLTYGSPDLDGLDGHEDHYFLGWDYKHAGDENDQPDVHEIVSEAESVINQLETMSPVDIVERYLIGVPHRIREQVEVRERDE